MDFIRSLILLALLPTLCLAAPTDRYEELTGEQDDFDAEEKAPWREERGEVPPLPGEDAWTEVRLDSLPARQHAFLALDSVSIGERDLVVRYWISIRSDGGGRLTTYEGVHCGQGNYIVYAYAHPRRDPRVRRVAEPKWKALSDARGGLRYRQELAHDVLCSGETPRSLRQIRDAALGRYEKANPFDNWTNDD